jgi:hypothetical protein
MPQNFLCGPDGTDRNEDESSRATESNTGRDPTNGQTRRKGRSEALNVDQCLRGLSQLPGLIALGIFTPAQGNSTRAVFATILQHLQKAQETPIPARATADLVQALRNHPELATILEPILTDEQLDSLMQEARDAEDGGDE